MKENHKIFIFMQLAGLGFVLLSCFLYYIVGFNKIEHGSIVFIMGILGVCFLNILGGISCFVGDEKK